MTVTNKQFRSWLAEVRPALERHDEHVPSPAKPTDMLLALYEWPRPGEIHFRGGVEAGGMMVPIECELAPGATVALDDITLKLGE